MEFMDIFTLAVLGLGLLWGIFKGFLGIVLKIGAFFLSVLLAKPIGNLIFNAFFADKFGELLTVILSLGISVIVFIALYIIFKLLVKALARILTSLFSSKLLDKLLGAIAGLAVSGGFMMLVGTVFGIVAAILDNFGGAPDVLSGEGTFLFRFFL